MSLMGFLGETEEVDYIIDPRPGTAGGLVTMNLRCPTGQVYSVPEQRCKVYSDTTPGTPLGNAQALSSWLSSSFDFFGLQIPNVLGLAGVVAGAVYLASKGK